MHGILKPTYLSILQKFCKVETNKATKHEPKQERNVDHLISKGGFLR